LTEINTNSELRESGLLKQRKGRFIASALILLMLIVGVVLVFASKAGSFLVVNAPEPSDVIVVLAGETDRRPARALELLHEGYAPRVVLDVPADARIFGFTDLQLAQGYVRNLQDAAAVHICPIEGLSTKAEAMDEIECLSREQGGRILLVTSDYHTRRALSIFRREIPRKHFSVAAAYDDHEFGTRWWTHREWAKTFLAEWMKTIWWNLVDRWL
jgi:uncharacterized SAM-binding protein YcdF (DUF218 family)